MLSSTLIEIDRLIDTLSPEEQLWLLERIARKVRQRTQVKDIADRRRMRYTFVCIAAAIFAAAIQTSQKAVPRRACNPL
ncbi:hypothetical protein MiSe_89360 [Microseira wollei NIES-4236]|uniref:Transposase n=1 Tax=Microseira wollei NIES-4236 TaxID=2530354 RepID=A0AAV3XTM8_9CYAN|nr:hypothetical protein MiSe_89360 [Microseira wollei NIES-4236]